MTKRLLKTMLLPLTVIAAAFAFIACDGTTPDVKYKVTYVIGADAEGTAPTETDKAFGEKFKLKSADGITYDGKTFAGWNDGSITYQAGDTYTMPAKAVTFTAQWGPGGDPLNTYTVTYKYGAAGEDVVKENQAAENYALEAPATYLDTGNDEYYKLFAGWTVENGDGTVYLPNAKLTLTGDTVFEAQWVDFDDDNVWFDTTYELQLILLTDKVGTLILNLGGEDEENPDLLWTYFTYAVSGTAITVTPVVGNPATGTLDDGELTLSITVGMAMYNFAPQQSLPEFTFQLNGGTGMVPTLTVTEEMYDDAEDCYVVTMPENTIIPPAGKQFKEWLVTAASGGERRVAAGDSYYATAGTYTVTPEWEDAGEPVPEGTLFYGRCTLPTQGLLGGETVVKIILNNTDAANVLVYYQLVGENTYNSAQKGTAVQDSWKPTDVYGADALYYGEYKIGSRAWNMVVKPDLTALWLCDTSQDEPLENGEFTLTPPEPETYTVTYNKPDDAEGTMADVTAQEGEYTLAACTYTKAGWTFLGWKDESLGYYDDPVVTAAGETVTLSEDVSYIAVFAKTYTNANDSTVTIALRDDEYVLWNADGDLVYAVWAPVSENVIMVANGWSYTAYININGNTYTESDELVAYIFTTADGNTTLTFDGNGKAMLGTHEGTYEKMMESQGWYGDVLVGVKLTFGGNTYECEFVFDVDANPYINATITVGGVDYVFNPYTEYTVTFEVGSGATGTAPAQKTVEVIGGGEGKVTLPDAEQDMQKTGYGFMGWKVKDGDDTLRYAGFQCTITGNTTFVAVWGEIKTYTVTYEIGEDVTGTAPASTTVDTEPDQVMAAVSLNNGAGLTKEGYKFEGWKKKNSDDTLSDTVYKGYVPISSDTTFVAYFTEIVVSDITLADFAGASSSAPKEYGYASLDAVGYVAGAEGVEEVKGNAFYTLNSMGVKKISYKIQVYWVSGKLTIKLVSGFTSQTLVKDSASSGQNVTSENDVANDYYVISNPNTITIKFGVDAEGRKTITLQMAQLTVNDETIQAQEITWTEMAA